MMAASDYRRWRNVVANGINRTDLLTVSEEDFVGGLRDKFDRYKRDTFLSAKQTDWLETIEQKLMSEMGSTYEEDGNGN